MVLDNAIAHFHMLQDLHHDIKFVFLPPNTTSLLQLMDQGVIRMFKAHYLQKTWLDLSLKCDVSLDELEKAPQAPGKTKVELQKAVVWHHWRMYTICDTICHVCNTWKEVTESCIRGCGKNSVRSLPSTSGASTCLRGFLACLKCLKLAWKVVLDELEEEDVDSLMEMIGEELSTEELDELEKQ